MDARLATISIQDKRIAELEAALERSERLHKEDHEKLQSWVKGSGPLIAELEAKLAKAREGLEGVFIGGNHLALIIGVDHPTYTTDHFEALEFYGEDRLTEYNAWSAWAAIMRVRLTLKELDHG